MNIRPARCGFTPPRVLEHLARRGIEAARVSAHKSKETRARRSAETKQLATILGTARLTDAPSAGERQVFDSQNTWEQQKKRVRVENEAASADPSVNKVYDYAGAVRGYFKDVLNRNSIDNAGMKLILNVHFGVNYMNAFWDGDEMTFGDGDGAIFLNFALSLDVVAHELAHGVTQFTANLDYNSQSGALNEHFSDVFGSAITQHAAGETVDSADWLIGDEIMGPELYGEALRSMKAPGTAYDNPLLGKDSQPDHMSKYYAGPEDNHGVHINSGILNKAFYLTASDIGTDKAVLIWYAALQKLWPTANFNDAVVVLVESARLLIKTGKVPAGSPQVVRSAFKAVGLPI